MLTKKLHNRMSALWRACAREFVRTAFESIRVHLASSDITTGMTLGSFIPIGRFLRVVSTLSIPVAVAHRSPMYNMDGNPVLGRSKNVFNGIDAGEDAHGITYGTPGRPVMTFNFRIEVFQYALHEYGLVPGSGPWNSLEKGAEAFWAYYDAHIDEVIPDIHGYVQGTMISEDFTYATD